LNRFSRQRLFEYFEFLILRKGALVGHLKLSSSHSLASLAMTCIMTTQGIAGSCDVLKSVGRTLADGQLYYRVAGATDWTYLPEGNGVGLGNTKAEFTYVIDETFEAWRAGVVIMKSGRQRKAGEEVSYPDVGTVKLVRKQSENFDNAPCGEVAPFGKGRVSSKSYDDYHDVGRSTDDDATLKAFHFNYTARQKRCHDTNSKLSDDFSPYARSNRGQFSFDTDVVDRGTYFQFFVLLHVTSANASSEKLALQRVETRQYRVSAGAPECVMFKHSIPAGEAFLRINDLESLSAGAIRGPEHRWVLSSP
jgi:hypothetical protein